MRRTKNLYSFPLSGPNLIFLEEESFESRPKVARSALVTSSRSNSESLSKAVSANITRILEDLLKNYDKTERPSFQDGEMIKAKFNLAVKRWWNLGKPTEVKVNILIRSMGPISEMKMVWHQSLYFESLFLLIVTIQVQSQNSKGLGLTLCPNKLKFLQ